MVTQAMQVDYATGALCETIDRSLVIEAGQIRSKAVPNPMNRPPG